MSDKNKLTLIFIIGGIEVSVEANLNSPLQAARNKALEQAKETGREPDQWEIKDASGKVLDPKMKVKDLGLEDGVKLFLGPKVSGGGCC
jgi:hypothetical protein